MVTAPAWTAHRQRKQKPSGISRGKKREKEREVGGRGTWLPATTPAGLLNYTHTRAAKCIRTSAVYRIQKRICSLKHARTHTSEVGQMRQNVNGAHKNVGLFWMPTHTYGSVPGRPNTFGLEPHSLLLIFDGVLRQLFFCVNSGGFVAVRDRDSGWAE